MFGVEIVKFNVTIESHPTAFTKVSVAVLLFSVYDIRCNGISLVMPVKIIKK